MRVDEETGAVSVFRRPSHYANGNTRDRQGRLITCEMGSQRLTRTGYDGSITVLADTFDGKPFTGPNDVVKSDGSIWFSDNGCRYSRQLSWRQGHGGVAVPCLSDRWTDRCTYRRDRRHGAAEWPCVLA
jgi:sugar lactone lactonase YvrE